MEYGEALSAYTAFQTNKFEVLDLTMNYADAHTACRLQKGHMPYVHSFNDLEEVQSLSKDTTNGIWVQVSTFLRSL